MLNGIKATNIKYMKQVYSNFSSVADPNDGSYTSSLIQKATEFVTGLAIFFCVIFGLIGLIKESQKGEITAEYWTKVFVSTVVAVTVVANINMVMDALYKTGGAFIDGMITVVDDNTSLESQQVTMDENKKKALLHALSLMPPFNGYQSGTSVPDPNNPAPDPDNPDENLTVGTIEDVWLEDYKVQVQTDDGRIVTATDPDKKDIIFAIKFPIAKDTPNPKLGSQEVRAGRTLIVKTQTFETSGTIRYVQIGEYDPPEAFQKP